MRRSIRLPWLMPKTQPCTVGRRYNAPIAASVSRTVESEF
jgi:hypothetical protein